MGIGQVGMAQAPSDSGGWRTGICRVACADWFALHCMGGHRAGVLKRERNEDA